MKTITLGDIATLLKLPAPADARKQVSGVAALSDAAESEISFLGSDRYLPQFHSTRAMAVIVQKRVRLPRDPGRTVFIVDDADLAVAKVLGIFAPTPSLPEPGIDPTARIPDTAEIPSDCRIGPYVVIGQRTRLGQGCILHPGVVIGDDVIVGNDCIFYPNVVIRERISIGNRVIIHAGSVLGTDGFGYRWTGEKHEKIPHVGTVVIEDDVEIGSCVCIDRAKFSSTVVGKGTKIDNLVQIGHNVRVGPHCIIVGQVGLAGSVVLGSNVVLGGQTAVRDHVTIGPGSMAAACSAVAEDVDAKTIVSGTPALPHRQSLREQAAFRRLPDLITQVRKMQDEIDTLKKSAGR
jgi:UDP-3-O-[3-hydroxymyristoyl] glucosamine N-acyltransferase